ncbi:MAG: ABC transporter ATP-binding protein, partial [Floccifex sp.]
QQRVSIARAIVGKPNIILADEPTGNLDRENAKQVIQLLKECQSLFSQTIILVTHDIDLAKHADFIIYMEDGQVKSYE